MIMTKEEQQKKLESAMLQAGVERYNKQLTIRGQEATAPGRRLMGMMTERLVGPIRETIERSMGPRRGRPTTHGAMLHKVKDVNPGTLALIAVRSALQTIGKGLQANAAANRIGQLVAEHDDWMKFSSAAPGIEYVTRDQLKGIGNEAHRRKVARNLVTTYHETSWTDKEKAGVGMWLLKMVEEHTGLVYLKTIPMKNKQRTVLEATPLTEEYLNSEHARCEVLSPVYTPMVCKPQPWTCLYDGGYLSRRVPLVKTRNTEYKDRLQKQALAGELDQVLDAINTLQETGYRINGGLLDVINSAYEANDHLPGVPDAENIPLPAKPVDIKHNEVARKAYRLEAREIHERNAEIKSARIAFRMAIEVANQYRDEDAIYFPHTLDFRGRAYPLPVFLHPQGDDMAKALLSFSEGKPLGEEGAIWLKVHTANLFGEDKVSFTERVQWVEDNMEYLLASAVDPVTQDFWTTADKPWQALAACFELLGYSIQGDDYVSHLPVAMDGSCNGLQHLSALLLDEVGGASVNLVPAEKPADIYTTVANRVAGKLAASDEPAHRRWAGLGVSRKLVKRPVMTTPYGVTNMGITDQLKGEIRDQELIAGNEGEWIEDGQKAERAYYNAASSLGTVLKDAISEEVLGSREVMDWLRDCARVAGKAGVALNWVNPVGLEAHGNYLVPGTNRYDTRIGGRKLRIRVANDTLTLNKRRMVTGISPNVVHSYDAAHMMMTVNRCAGAGITSLSMVHDSYATHACDVRDLSYMLRRVFEEIYSEDQLANLYHQFMDQMPADVDLPPPPARRGLDIHQVLESDYFFA
jgi:DNA-directed RNA polymerase